MSDYRNICVTDFETSSKNKYTCQPLQLACIMIDGKKLKVIDEYETLIRPTNFDILEEEGGIKVNKLKIEDLKKAPELKTVFPSFVEWIKKHNIRKDKSNWGAPIFAAYNVSYDYTIMERICEEMKLWDMEWHQQTLFNPIFKLDIMEWMWLLCRTNKKIRSVSLEKLLPYMGVEDLSQQHNAVFDTKMTAALAIKILKLAAFLTEVPQGSDKPRLKIEGCLAEEK